MRRDEKESTKEIRRNKKIKTQEKKHGKRRERKKTMG